MTFLSTSIFRKSAELLRKRPENGYANCLKDIADEICKLSFDDIYSKHYLVREMGDLRIIKLRIQNSELKQSSADGYRVWVACNKKHDHICLLEVYPKRGKYSRMDLSKSEKKNVVEVYGEELKAKELREHDCGKGLELVQQ